MNVLYGGCYKLSEENIHKNKEKSTYCLVKVNINILVSIIRAI